MMKLSDIGSLLSMPNPDLCAHYATELGMALARKKDALISDCITAVIGPDWTPESIRPRLTRERYQDAPQETWLLDGEPLVQIWPAQTGSHEEGFAQMADVSFQYLRYIGR